MQRLFAILGVLLLLGVSAHAQPWAGGADPVQGVGDTGTPRGKVLTVQGIAGGTPIVVDCDNCSGGSSDSITGGGSTCTASATGLSCTDPFNNSITTSDASGVVIQGDPRVLLRVPTGEGHSFELGTYRLRSDGRVQWSVNSSPRGTADLEVSRLAAGDLRISPASSGNGTVRVRNGISAVNFEGAVVQIDEAANEAMFGGETGGTGAANIDVRLKPAGGGVVFVDGVPAGAAAGKVVVCLDAATGQLHASSSSTDCAN